MQRVSHHALGYRITNSDPSGRYVINKEVIAHPHFSCMLQHNTITTQNAWQSRLQLYSLCAPHIEVGGRGNNAYVVEASGRLILAAEKKGTWLALGATIPFQRLSCGYVGSSDGWTDLADNMQMDWEFDRAVDGNVALTGQLDLDKVSNDFTLGLAFGNTLQNAISTLFQSLSTPFVDLLNNYIEQWDRPTSKILPQDQVSKDRGNLYYGSYSLLLAHEDKSYPGAFIASLSIPWGEAKGDEDLGGYHLVWTRDMVNMATALLAAGNTDTPLRALIYLVTSQQEDGGFPQNSWIDGEPYCEGVQLDEVAFPIMLAWRLQQANALRNFDPYPMVIRAARYLVREGPATQQERWEEASGYSPSTLASNIAALICAASFARERGDKDSAQFLEDYADFLECHIEDWTVTRNGTLLPTEKEHYIRVLPVDVHDPHPDEDPETAILVLANQSPGSANAFPAKEIVDAGFLELVRYGIRRPDDPLITSSLKVVDSFLKVDTPSGPCWHRYNNDGYGQREDGGPYVGWGRGRAWPLLTGERGMYELAAGNDAISFLDTIERFSSLTGLLPEQVWDEQDRKENHLLLGRPTGSAMPLVWAHAEYIKLLRSTFDGKVFDLIPQVASRYLSGRSMCKPMEIWKMSRQTRSVKRGHTLRVQAPDTFRLRWTRDGWSNVEDTDSSTTALGIRFVDIQISELQQNPICFTFFWIQEGRWEGKDYAVEIN